MRLRIFAGVFLFAAFLLAQTSNAQQASNAQTSQPDHTQDTTNAADENHSGRQTHVKLGSLGTSAGYSYASVFYPWYPVGWYADRPYIASTWDPFWGPFGPYYYPVGLVYSADKGELQLKADPKDAEVYIDGAYAGTVQHLKNIWLEPGVYNLSFSAVGHESFQRRIYVLSGKTLNITAKLSLKKIPPANHYEP